MKKEEVVSTSIMTVVCTLVLIGFTIAWYSVFGERATVFGMHLQAAEIANIKITLESVETNPDAEDVAVLAEQDPPVYAEIGLEELTNIEIGKLAPGTFGEVTFYVTPTAEGIVYCDIVPEVWIRQNEDAWYSGADGAEDTEESLAELYEITQRHFAFFSQENMTPDSMIDEAAPLRLEWNETESQEKAEKKVVIYWQWYYEYPFTEYTEEEKNQLSDELVQQMIDEYDAEDTEMGNNITDMKFHFTFSAQ